MKILVDTHILLWLLTGDKKLSKKAKSYLLDEENTVYYSTVSPWEISTKHLSHPDKMPFNGSQVIMACSKSGLKVLGIHKRHIEEMDNLKRDENEPMHNDPFDRMLLAQAKSENMILLTRDELIRGYHEDCVVIC